MIPRRAGLLLVSLTGALLLGLSAAPPARADGTAIDRLTVDYRLDTDGVLHVTESWEWSHAETSGAPMERALLVREPDPADPRYDIHYRIEGFDVSSSTGSPTDHTVESRTEPDGRVVRDVYRIGDPGHRPSGDLTYRLSYRVATVVRSDRDDGYDAFDWWSPELLHRPSIGTLRLELRVPGGTDQVECQLRGPGPYAGCGGLEVDTGADPSRIRVTEHGLDPADAVHLQVLIEPGVIADNQLTRSRRLPGGLQLPAGPVLPAATALVGAVSTLLVVLVVRRRRGTRVR